MGLSACPSFTGHQRLKRSIAVSGIDEIPAWAAGATLAMHVHAGQALWLIQRPAVTFALS